MRGMKALFMALVVSLFAVVACDGRAVQVLEMKELMRKSALVFAGRVKSVAPSGMTTELAYPTWKGAAFEWLKVEMEVIEPIKGVKKGEVVRTMLLSEKGERMIIFNPPGMVRPEVGRPYLCCLLPVADGEGYASITAPFDDDEGVFLLDRKDWVHEGATYYDDQGKEVSFREQNERNAALWNLVDGKGAILPAGAAAIRKKYAAEIGTPVPKESVIYLKWKKETGGDGWQWNVPADPKGKAKPRSGPVSK